LFVFSFSFFLHSTLYFLNSSSFRLLLSVSVHLPLLYSYFLPVCSVFLSFISSFPSFFFLPLVSFIFYHSLIASFPRPLSVTEDIQSLAALNLGF
jgi:hypothetical protein